MTWGWDVAEAFSAPRSVAVVGVSASGEGWGNRVLELLKRHPRADRQIYAVGRSSGTIDGLHGDLSELPEVPDLVIVTAPAPATPDIVARAARTGVKAAIVLSAGFAETGPEGQALQDELVRAAAPMALIGPNCAGLIDRTTGLPASISYLLDRELTGEIAPVAVVSHSGGVGFYLADVLGRHGPGWAQCVSVGNEAQMDLIDVSELFIKTGTRALVLYIERPCSVHRIVAMCREAQRQHVRIVALLGGRSQFGRGAALTHTGAVADHGRLEALLHRCGVVVARSESEVISAVTSALGPPRALATNPRIAVLTMSGGMGVLTSDRLSAAGVSMPTLPASLRGPLSEVGARSLSNPVDLGAVLVDHLDSLAGLLQQLAADPAIDGVVLTLNFGFSMEEQLISIADQLAQSEDNCWMMWGGCTAETKSRLVSPEIVASSVDELIGLIAAAQHDRSLEAPVDVITKSVTGPTRILTETTARDLLAGWGVPIATALHGTNPALLQSQAEDHPSGRGPWVVKAVHEKVPHRAEVGALELGVELGDLADAATRVSTAARVAGEIDPQNPVEVIAQPLIASRGELFVGAARDEEGLLCILVGRGGSDVEAREHATAVSPLTDRDHARLLSAAASAVPSADLNAVAELLSRVDAGLQQQPLVTELDINPVLVTLNGSLCAVDALAVVDDA